MDGTTARKRLNSLLVMGPRSRSAGHTRLLSKVRLYRSLVADLEVLFEPRQQWKCIERVEEDGRCEYPRLSEESEENRDEATQSGIVELY